MMNNLNLHNRHPKDLPDKETIEDILLELEDTRKFEIKWVNLDNMSWRADNKVFYNWLEKGEVVTCEMEPINYSFDLDTMSYATVKHIRYDILRHPIRLEVRRASVPYRSEAGILSINRTGVELIRTSEDVYLRLKDYLGPDVIQSQSQTPNFVIDFMLTSCRIK
jgi:hypothetical protein